MVEMEVFSELAAILIRLVGSQEGRSAVDVVLLPIPVAKASFLVEGTVVGAKDFGIQAAQAPLHKVGHAGRGQGDQALVFGGVDVLLAGLIEKGEDRLTLNRSRQGKNPHSTLQYRVPQKPPNAKEVASPRLPSRIRTLRELPLSH